MAQTSFTNSLTALMEGQIAQNRLSADVQSKIVDETNGIYPGRICLLKDSAGKTARMPYSGTATITLDADLVASNVLAGNIIVNGVTTAYTETYATSHNATMTALAAEIAAISGIDTATASGRVITITADAETDIYVATGAVTGGAGQAGVTLANTESGTFYGPALLSGLEPSTTGGSTVTFADGTAVGLGRKVYFCARTDDTIVPGSALAVRFYEESAADKKRGMVMLASGVGTSPVLGKAWTALNVEVGASAGGLAVLSLNLP